MKQIDTLVDDIYELFRGPHKVNEENLEKFKSEVAEAVRKSLEEAGTVQPFTLRMSNIGTKDRKLYYDSKSDVHIHKPNDYIKFLFGHILEHLVLFLVRESGHVVSNEQEEVELEGIKGHKDGHIDGVLCDVKSASSYSYRKFVDGNFPADDPFGYRYQLKGYYEADIPKDSEEVAWVVIDKQYGDIFVKRMHEVELPDARGRIKDVKEIIESGVPPDHCYTPEYDSSGNLPIPKGCEWCPHVTNSNRCWGNKVRSFYYSTGVKHFLEVNKQPRVPEITERFFRKSD